MFSVFCSVFSIKDVNFYSHRERFIFTAKFHLLKSHPPCLSHTKMKKARVLSQAHWRDRSINKARPTQGPSLRYRTGVRRAAGSRRRATAETQGSGARGSMAQGGLCWVSWDMGSRPTLLHSQSQDRVK